MCGICGWFNTQGKVNIDEIEKMNNIAKYRGPDDEGYLVLSENNETKHICGDDTSVEGLTHIKELKDKFGITLAMGHRRLSILDLSVAGHQPMCIDNDTLAITYNGEIYNYIEVRNELITKGYCFKSNCDTEVILQAYKEWGEECVQHFNGMWSFVIWDKAKAKLFASRDRLGAKPFYYYYDGANFVFSSELKQLCQCSIMPRTLNESVLVAQIAYGISDYSDECLINEAKVLPGGHSLTLNYKKESEEVELNIYKYWDIDTNQKDEDAKNHLFEYLDQSVKIRMRSDVPVGILLSGGLDSSILTAKIIETYSELGKNPGDIQTFTSCYEDFEAGDERNFAHMVNEYCGTTERFIYPEVEDAFELYKQMIWHYDGPTAMSCMGGYLTLREASKYGCKVMINGQGSDETMFGYERYYAWYLKDVFKEKGLNAFAKEFKKSVNNSRLSAWELAGYMVYFLSPKVRKERCKKRVRNYVSKEFLELFDKNQNLIDVVTSGSLSELQYNELRRTQLTHILRWDDRSYMAFSMESRVPYIDYHYIEQSVKVPENIKIRDGYTKVLLRDNIDGHLPDEVVWRKNKMGWPSPVERWVRSMDKSKVNELFENPRSERYFNVPELKKLFESNPTHRMVDMYINIELFMRMFDVSVKSL